MTSLPSGAKAEPLLSIEGLSKSFGATKAVRDASFGVGAVEIVALLEQNGAGKSTVIKLLAGVHQPDAGEIRLSGKRFDAGAKSGGGIAFMARCMVG